MDSDTPKTTQQIQEIVTQLFADIDELRKKARRARSLDKQCQYFEEMRVIEASIKSWMLELLKREIDLDQLEMIPWGWHLERLKRQIAAQNAEVLS